MQVEKAADVFTILLHLYSIQKQSKLKAKHFYCLSKGNLSQKNIRHLDLSEYLFRLRGTNHHFLFNHISTKFHHILIVTIFKTRCDNFLQDQIKRKEQPMKRAFSQKHLDHLRDRTKTILKNSINVKFRNIRRKLKQLPVIVKCEMAFKFYQRCIFLK